MSLTSQIKEVEPTFVGNPPTIEDDTVPGGNSVDDALAKRLRIAVDRVKSVSAASRLSGVPVGTLNNYLAGRDMKRGALLAIADATGVSLEWLASGRGPVEAPSQVIISMHSAGSVDRPATPAEIALPAGYVRIPRFSIAASAGHGALATTEHPQVVEYVAYAEDFLRAHLRRRPEDLGLIETRGDSMEPTIPDGAVLTLDVSERQTLENGRLYVVAVGDALVVKRVELRMTAIVLHSDNPRYPPEIIDRADAEQLHVIGQVLLVSAPPR